MGGGAWQLYIIGPPGPQRRGKAPRLEAGIYKKGMEMSPYPLLPKLASNRLKKNKKRHPPYGQWHFGTRLLCRLSTAQILYVFIIADGRENCNIPSKDIGAGVVLVLFEM